MHEHGSAAPLVPSAQPLLYFAHTLKIWYNSKQGYLHRHSLTNVWSFSSGAEFAPPLLHDAVAVEEDVPAALLVPLVQLLHKLPVAGQPGVLHRVVVPLLASPLLPRPASAGALSSGVPCHAPCEIAIHGLAQLLELHSLVIRLGARADCQSVLLYQKSCIKNQQSAAFIC